MHMPIGMKELEKIINEDTENLNTLYNKITNTTNTTNKKQIKHIIDKRETEKAITLKIAKSLIQLSLSQQGHVQDL